MDKIFPGIVTYARFLRFIPLTGVVDMWMFKSSLKQNMKILGNMEYEDIGLYQVSLETNDSKFVLRTHGKKEESEITLNQVMATENTKPHYRNLFRITIVRYSQSLGVYINDVGEIGLSDMSFLITNCSLGPDVLGLSMRIVEEFEVNGDNLQTQIFAHNTPTTFNGCDKSFLLTVKARLEQAISYQMNVIATMLPPRFIVNAVDKATEYMVFMGAPYTNVAFYVSPNRANINAVTDQTIFDLFAITLNSIPYKFSVHVTRTAGDGVASGFTLFLNEGRLGNLPFNATVGQNLVFWIMFSFDKSHVRWSVNGTQPQQHYVDTNIFDRLDYKLLYGSKNPTSRYTFGLSNTTFQLQLLHTSTISLAQFDNTVSDYYKSYINNYTVGMNESNAASFPQKLVVPKTRRVMPPSYYHQRIAIRR